MTVKPHKETLKHLLAMNEIGKRKTMANQQQVRNVRQCNRDSQLHIDWQSTKKTVTDRIAHIFNNTDMSDIMFTCQGSNKIFYAHKLVLATSSAVFKAMFYGTLAEKRSTVHLSDTDEKSLEEFLMFLYKDNCNWSYLEAEDVANIMYLSKKYIVPSLTEECVEVFNDIMNPENVLYILERAIHFDEKHLETECWGFIDWNIEIIANMEYLSSISHETLTSLLKRESLEISEVTLFKAVLKWIDCQCLQKGLDLTRDNKRSVIGDAIYELRFLGMGEDLFAKHVATCGLLTAEEIVTIYNKFNGIGSPDLKWK